MPPMRYVLEWRMAVAKDLLLRESRNLAEVAERIGYQSANALSAALTRMAGCSPSEFARSKQADLTSSHHGDRENFAREEQATVLNRSTD